MATLVQHCCFDQLFGLKFANHGMHHLRSMGSQISYTNLPGVWVVFIGFSMEGSLCALAHMFCTSRKGGRGGGGWGHLQGAVHMAAAIAC